MTKQAVDVAVTADTSVVVPALADWHEHHAIARKAVRAVRRLPAHVVLESFSVLTRLPHGLALSTMTAAQLLSSGFPGSPLTLDAAGYARLPGLIAKAGLRGAQVYDALIAVTSAVSDFRLLTLDARAWPTYQAVGVQFHMLER